MSFLAKTLTPFLPVVAMHMQWIERWDSICARQAADTEQREGDILLSVILGQERNQQATEGFAAHVPPGLR